MRLPRAFPNCVRAEKSNGPPGPFRPDLGVQATRALTELWNALISVSPCHRLSLPRSVHVPHECRSVPQSGSVPVGQFELPQSLTNHGGVSHGAACHTDQVSNLIRILRIDQIILRGNASFCG